MTPNPTTDNEVTTPCIASVTALTCPHPGMIGQAVNPQNRSSHTLPGH